MVRIADIDWQRTDQSHVTRHGFTEEDIEDFIFTSDYAPRIEQVDDQRYVVFGRTSSGDYGTAYFEQVTDRNIVVVSARPSSPSEKKRYREVCRSKRNEDSTAV